MRKARLDDNRGGLDFVPWVRQDSGVKKRWVSCSMVGIMWQARPEHRAYLMTDKYSQLEAVLNRRKALAEKFRVQHQTLHEDRNRTAGEIYENTKNLERMASEFIDASRREDYAQSWIDRWPRK